MASRIVARILLGLKKEGNLHNTYEALHFLAYGMCAPLPEWRDDYDTFSEALLSNPSTKEFFSFEWYTRLMQTFHINMISVSPEVSVFDTPTAQHDSIGLFFLLSFANHSCVPNSKLVFVDNHHARLVSNQQIRNGEEIFISYINNELPTEKRLRHLEQHYGFVCNCAKCNNK